MQVKEMMHKNPVCCTPETRLNDVARLMVDCDCGAIPVVEDMKTLKPIKGIVTDRDIVCRILAEDKNPLRYRAKDCMSEPVATVKQEDSVETAVEIMEKYQIRRIPVVDQNGACCGLVTQAQIAKRLPEEKAGELLKSVSQPTEEPSRVPAGVA